jgi:hypothetical protein
LRAAVIEISSFDGATGGSASRLEYTAATPPAETHISLEWLYIFVWAVSASAFARELKRTDFGFRCDNDVVQLAAPRAGVSIGGCQEGFARARRTSCRSSPAFQIALEVWLVRRRDLKSTSRVRLMFDWLAEGLLDYVKGKRLPAER